MSEFWAVSTVRLRTVVRGKRGSATAILALGLLFCGMISSVAAEQREIAGAQQVGKLDAVLVMDASASMRITDPEKLRDEGAKLFAQFLKAGDRIAIVSFGESASVVSPFTEATELAGNFQAELAKVGNSGRYTNILEGIRAGAKLLSDNAREDATPVMVLLSDGKMEPAPAAGTAGELTTRLIETVLPDLKAAGVKVHSLGFSEQVDRDLLSQIAASTDGVFWFTPEADRIHESFSDLFLVVKKPQVLPLSAKGIKIDAAVQEATFYVNRGEMNEVILTDPQGEQLSSSSHPSDIKWFQGKNFDVITLPNPRVGDWKVTGVSANDGFATVLTNLKLITDWGTSMHSSEPTLLQARLYDNDKPIVLSEISSVMKYGFQIIPTDKISEPVLLGFLVDDGTNGDKIAGDGIFSAAVNLDDSGEYKLSIVAKAPTFQRSQQIPFRVKQRLVSLAVGKSEDGAHGHGEGGGHGHVENADVGHGDDAHGDDEQGGEHGSAEGLSFNVTLSSELLGIKSMDLKLFAVDLDKRKLILPLTKTGEKGLRFSAAVSLLPRAGHYHLEAELSGERRKEGKLKTASNKIEFHYQPDGAAEEHAIEVVEETHVKMVPATATEPFPIIQLLAMTALNLLAAGLSFVLLKQNASGTKIAIPKFEGIEALSATLAQVRVKLESSEVNFDDPIFHEQSNDADTASDSGSGGPEGSSESS